MPTLLKFVKKNDPILREIMPPVSNFADPLLHETIENMCYSILSPQLKAAHGAHDSAAGMAANQWGIKQRIFIFTPDGSDEGKRMEVMVNPSYSPLLRPNETEYKMVAAYEGCFSVPLTTCIINRYDAITATYFTPQGKKVERIMQGWEARVFQHETDHLDGKLMDGRCDNYAGPECLERVIFKDEADMESYWDKKIKESRKKQD